MCKLCKITEYLGIVIGSFLLGGMFLGWAFSGEILKIIVGFIMLFVLAISLFVISLREVLYWAGNHTKKDGQ